MEENMENNFRGHKGFSCGV